MKARLIGVAAILVLIAFAGSAIANDGNSSNGEGGPRNIVLISNGASVVNTHAAPETAAFASWCTADGPCAPSVMQPVNDASTGRPRGTIYVWTKNFTYAADGKSLCFGEFIWFALPEGSLYAHSGSRGTCGGFIDPSLKAPTHLTGVGQVIAGGGDGTIVGGTGKYAQWTGTFTDRVFVEFSFSGGANYYDQLFWSISRN